MSKASAHLYLLLDPARLACMAVLAGIALCGCGDDLGSCDMMTSQQLVYGRGDLVATKGQALMHDSCGNGAFCHSSAARGDQRHGAPAGMNFDMLPSPSGWPTVTDLRDEIWAVIDDGSMPPGKAGDEVLGDGDWRFDDARQGSERLPKVTSEEGKAVLRNWLACDAPVVTRTHAPGWLHPPGDGGTGLTDWSEIYSEVIAPSCALSGCHNNASAAGGLRMGSMCEAYAGLLASGASCGPRLTPGDSDSVLLDKIESTDPQCGDLGMPPGAPLDPEVVADIRAWVEAGAAASCE